MTMNFAKLTGDNSAFKKDEAGSYEFTPENDETKEPYQNGNGEPLVLKVHPFGTAHARSASKAIRIKYGREMAEGLKDSDEFTEDDIAEQIEMEEKRTAELVARMTVGWNLTDGENGPVAFDLETAVAFFSAATDIRRLTDISMTEAGRKTKKT